MKKSFKLRVASLALLMVFALSMLPQIPGGKVHAQADTISGGWNYKDVIVGDGYYIGISPERYPDRANLAFQHSFNNSDDLNRAIQNGLVALNNLQGSYKKAYKGQPIINGDTFVLTDKSKQVIAQYCSYNVGDDIDNASQDKPIAYRNGDVYFNLDGHEDSIGPVMHEEGLYRLSKETLSDNLNEDTKLYMSTQPRADVTERLREIGYTGDSVQCTISGNKNTSGLFKKVTDCNFRYTYFYDSRDGSITMPHDDFPGSSDPTYASFGLFMYDSDTGNRVPSVWFVNAEDADYITYFDITTKLPQDYYAGNRSVVYRMYCAANGEHLYTTSANEKNSLAQNPAWNYEGPGWYAPNADAPGAKPVYRLNNDGLHNHLYTSDLHEIDVLTKTQGWTMDNNGQPMFFSGGNIGIYRMYNRGMNGMHLLTTDSNEYNSLPGMTGGAWVQEGLSLNCLALGK